MTAYKDKVLAAVLAGKTTVDEIAAESGVPRAQIHTLLSNLFRQGQISQVATTKTFTATVFVYGPPNDTSTSVRIF